MTKRLQQMRNGSKTEGTNVYNKTFCNHKKPAYLCSTETSTVCTNMEAHKKQKDYERIRKRTLAAHRCDCNRSRYRYRKLLRRKKVEL